MAGIDPPWVIVLWILASNVQPQRNTKVTLLLFMGWFREGSPYSGRITVMMEVIVYCKKWWRDVIEMFKCFGISKWCGNDENEEHQQTPNVIYWVQRICKWFTIRKGYNEFGHQDNQQRVNVAPWKLR
ncbi:hypothetical protein CHS0354_026309 [Potamilus streckersoni]|uniref:Uncharacterized protein n=1 Tax=Potamilus streckersoni TaxID=2493646 RepID=A0AAE0TB25_9BIVA|nr:hypothetical protein CHS0354_026309 [Potamilus streckersoni]